MLERYCKMDYKDLGGYREITVNFYEIEANKKITFNSYKGVKFFSKVLSIKNPKKI